MARVAAVHALNKGHRNAWKNVNYQRDDRNSWTPKRFQRLNNTLNNIGFSVHARVASDHSSLAEKIQKTRKKANLRKMMLYNWSMLGESLGISFVNVMVISTAFPLFVSRLHFVTGSCSRFGRNNIIPSKACTWPMRPLWLFRRATRSRLDTISGLKLTLYWYTPKFVLVINLKWFVTNWIFFPVPPFLSTTCAGFCDRIQ